MTRFDANVIGFILLLGAVGGLYRYAVESDDRFPPNAAQVTSSSEQASALALLDKPRALPELRFVNGNEDALSLADFHGKIVLLNIWATWCVPCRKEMPTLDRLQAKLGGTDFEVVALSIDQGGIAKVQAFYREIGIHSLGVYVDTAGYVARNLNIVGVPTTLLIDRDGRELGRAIGPAEWDSPEIVSLIKRTVVAPPAAQSGVEALPRRSAVPFDSAWLPSWPHADVNLQGIDRKMSL